MATSKIKTPTTLAKIRGALPNGFKLASKNATPKRVTPTVYTQNMAMSTEERQASTREVQRPRILELLAMSQSTHHKLAPVDVDQALFQPCPSELFFQNFTSGQTYKLPLILFNNDKVSRHVRLEQQVSQYFSVVGPEDVVSKVAPGLASTFTVFFTPQENKDYEYQLIFVTERERFEVPIHAIGPRANLNFRDELRFSPCVVKSTVERTQCVFNTGNSRAIFELKAQRPFSVTPLCGTLDVGEWMQVIVSFQPMITGDYSKDLVLHYHTGEDVVIGLYGACEELKVQILPNSVLLPRTYISLASESKTTITNTSGITLYYRWSEWPSLEGEYLSLRDSSAQTEEEGEREGEEEKDPTAMQRVPLRARSLQNHRKKSAKEHLALFSNSCITLCPVEGEIWPGMTREFSVVFKPEEPRLYQQTIYCDITGRRSRLPLTIQGEGIGPKLQLDYDIWDMKSVVIGSKNRYEVAMTNKGLIDAPFKLSYPDTTFGRCFSCSPEEGVVPLGACQTVQVTFHSLNLGTFSEKLLLSVRGQPKPPTLTFRGCVVAPSINFNVVELEIGDVAFGFPKTSSFILSNTSLVRVTFRLRILGDGIGSPSITYSQQISELSRTNWQSSAEKDVDEHPVEFSIHPAAGNLQPMSGVTVKVTLCSNTVKTYTVVLVVDVEGVGEEVRILPINARCAVPDIVLDTPLMDFQRCFLSCRYEQQVQLTNPSALPVCYGVLDQKCENPALCYGSSQPRGVIPPYTSHRIPVFLLAKIVGKLLHSLYIVVFGSDQAPMEVILSCIGQGPLVHVEHPHLDYGRIQVLQDVTRTMRLFNQSPIPAKFRACMLNAKSFWNVMPSKGEVPADNEVELQVVAHLKDTLDFQEWLEVSIQDSQTITVSLSATGKGTTIISDKSFAPSLDLGTHFSYEPLQYNFTLTNLGLRVHRMYWKTESFSLNTQGTSLSRKGNKDKSVFSLRPSRVELFPGCSVDMVLSGSSNSPKVVQERLVCNAIVGPNGHLERLITVDIACSFVPPVLGFSSRKLNFHLKRVPGQDLTAVYEKLVLKNLSSLTVSMKLSVEKPFSLCDAPRAESSATTRRFVLGDRKAAELWVGFHPEYCQAQLSQVVDKFLMVHYEEHPQQDMVELHAEVNFPNLHFSTTSVDFGCILNHTETYQTITITNCSKLPVSYRWAFMEEQKCCRSRKTQKIQEEQVADKVVSYPIKPALNEVFDVLPLHGLLQPGFQQVVKVSFYAHQHVSRQAVALCLLEEGPTYEIKVRGEASVVTYNLDSSKINLGKLLFDHVGEAELTLRNTGKVGFRFRIINPLMEEGQEEEKMDEPIAKVVKIQAPIDGDEEDDELQRIIPGQPLVIPDLGYLEGGTVQRLRVLYLPAVPEVFERHLQLRVAFFPPQDITVSGEGVFPRISLNLPRNLTEIQCDGRQMARVTAGGKEKLAAEKAKEAERVSMEMERTLVKEDALAVVAAFPERRDLKLCFKAWYKVSKFMLPEYILDFGHVIPGRGVSQTVRVTNNGSVPVCFQVNHKPLADTGFSVDSERERLPCGKSQTISIALKAHLEQGNISVVMPIQVMGGPTVQIRLCAMVTVPAISVSTDTLMFDCIQCGMCQMKTIQLVNPESVPCHWEMEEYVKPAKEIDKFVPLHLHKKVLLMQRPPPVVFEVIPKTGVLNMGERVNVHVKFSPTAGETYNRQIVVNVIDSIERVFITAQGEGEEPELEFCPSEVELGPCLPGSTDIEAEVVVRNHCSFPIEFYSLEFDTQYLEEENILRLMSGYDEKNRLLLPPRVPGESLLGELFGKAKEQSSQLSESTASTNMETEVPADTEKQIDSAAASKSVARLMHLNSSSAAAGRCNKGIAVIVYGAPQTDEIGTATTLARYYGGACLHVDTIITDILLHVSSPLSQTARTFYDAAVADYAKKQAALERSMADKQPTECPETSEGGSSGSQSGAAKEEESGGSTSSVVSVDSEKPYESLCMGGDESTLKGILPDHLLVEILEDRFQHKDCFRGIIIDSLTSVYTRSASTTLQLILKALNNRKRIFVINLLDSFAAKKSRELAEKQAKEARQKAEMDKREQWLQELDEDMYDALPEKQKKYVDQLHNERLQQRKRREFERQQRELEAKRQEEEMKRAKEEEIKKKVKKSGKRDSKETPKRKNSMDGKTSTEALQKPKTANHSNDSLPEVKEQQNARKAQRNSKMSADSQKLEENIKPVIGKLQARFIAYETTKLQVEHILHHWDRTQGLLPVPLPKEDASVSEEQRAAPTEASKDGEDYSPDSIPHFMLNVRETEHQSVTNLLEDGLLPPAGEVLDDLGLGPSGPPIPPPITLSVISFPKKREQPSVHINSDYFTFLNPQEPEKEVEEKVDEEETRDDGGYKSRKKDCAMAKDKKRKTKSRMGPRHRATASEHEVDHHHEKLVELKRSQRLTSFRWVVPAQGEILLRIQFYSESLGEYNQTFNFELMGKQKRYQLFCNGISTYPSICSSYLTLFALSEKVPEVMEGLQKAYVVKPGYFEFGPLVCGKNREKYKENRFPENMEELMFHNNSGLETEVEFTFSHDSNGNTFLLDPPTVILKPDEQKSVRVWAFPNKVDQIRDKIICCVKDNPVPVMIDISCWGVEPALLLETKHLTFDKILLNKASLLPVTLHNKTALPVSWKLQGVEELGDEFHVPHDTGIVPPYSTCAVSVQFKSKRPVHVKKTLRLEVSDVDKILGIVHVESIHVRAEAYDIALDISPDGCLDYGVMKVFDEQKLSLRMKNQGKYKIDFKFMLEQIDPNGPKLDSIFTVNPPSGTLMPNQKAVTVHIICKSKTEVYIGNQPILHCQVIEPNLNHGKETIALGVSVQTVFSRYKISPENEIDFGPLSYGCKKTHTFIIENTGVFETRYNITRMITDPALVAKQGGPDKKESISTRPTAASNKSRMESTTKEMFPTQSRLTFGVFSVSPCAGNLQPGGSTVVSVECSAEQQGIWNQGLLIDINKRDPFDFPDGIPYRLLAEICKPAILLDTSSIFEEHRICKTSKELLSEELCELESVYVLDDHKLVFNKVLVKRTAQVRLKLTNDIKVSCELLLSIRYSSKANRDQDVFELSTTSLKIPCQSHSYVVVTFTPHSKHLYSAVFEASMKGARMTPMKTKVLEFDLVGEGRLPSVCVVGLALKDSGGAPMLQFRRVLVRRRHTLALVLLNNGNTSAKIQVDMLDRHGVFTLKLVPKNSPFQCVRLEASADTDNHVVHRANLKLSVNERVEFEVGFSSEEPMGVKAKMTVTVEDNPNSNMIIPLSAEAYYQIVTLDHIQGSLQETERPDDDKGYYELLTFKDCRVDCPYEESFIMTNHSSSQALRFEWQPAGGHVSFSPQVGHLHAGCSKVVIVTFCAKQPLTLKEQPNKCKLWQVEFEQPVDQVTDWDDRMSFREKAAEMDHQEPCCSMVEGSQLEVELRVSALSDYTKFICETKSIEFGYTAPHQCRDQQIHLMNVGSVKLEYSWQVLMTGTTGDDQGDGSSSHHCSRADSAGGQRSSAIATMSRLRGYCPTPPFIVEPILGVIEPGSIQDISIHFTPDKAAQFEGRLVCSIPNLQDNSQGHCISVCGQSLQPVEVKPSRKQ